MSVFYSFPVIFPKIDEIALNGEIDDRAVFIYGDESMGPHERQDREFWKDHY